MNKEQSRGENLAMQFRPFISPGVRTEKDVDEVVKQMGIAIDQLIQEEKGKPKNTIIIEISGGVVTNVTTHEEIVEVIIVDYDCQDAHDDECVEIPENGRAMIQMYDEHPEVSHLRNGETRASQIIDIVTAHYSEQVNPSEE